MFEESIRILVSFIATKQIWSWSGRLEVLKPFELGSIFSSESNPSGSWTLGKLLTPLNPESYCLNLPVSFISIFLVFKNTCSPLDG